MNITQYIQQQTSIPAKQIENTIQLLNEDCTIPFISRYRKEMTGNLDEIQISAIAKSKLNFEEIEKRKITILKAIEEQNALTPELKQKIENCFDENLLEDYYLPYKKKKKTKATIAKEQGLEPLAKIGMKQNPVRDLEELANRYLNDEINSAEEAIQGAKHIMAEWINENERVRNQLRRKFNYEAVISSKVVKSKKDEENAQKFAQYFEFSEPLKSCAPHRLLAILRGENEGFLKVSIQVEKQEAIEIIKKLILKTNQPDLVEIIEEAIEDAYKRLLEPSLSNEVLKEAKLIADKSSIQVFSNN